MAIEAATFLGSSPIRRLVEDWSVEHLVRTTEEAVRFAVSEGLPVMYVTEDTMRTDPATVKKLYMTAVECGARSLVFCDTVGHATPRGAYNLIQFAIEEIVKPSREKLRVDWHGHNDRGLAVANSLAAVAAGANQVHAAGMSLGERVGNTAMELMLVNLRLMGAIDRDLTRLKEYSETIARATHTVIPPNYPVVGRDAFRTATGVHAAAIVKALRLNDPNLANMIYSGVPSQLFGLQQSIEVGPLSGRSNVIYWLESRGFTASDELVDRIFRAAKESQRVMSDAELHSLVDATGAAKSRTPLIRESPRPVFCALRNASIAGGCPHGSLRTGLTRVALVRGCGSIARPPRPIPRCPVPAYRQAAARCPRSRYGYHAPDRVHVDSPPNTLCRNRGGPAPG